MYSKRIETEIHGHKIPILCKCGRSIFLVNDGENKLMCENGHQIGEIQVPHDRFTESLIDANLKI